MLKKCSNCKKEIDGGRIVWITTAKNIVIRCLCDSCINKLKNDKNILKYEIKGSKND